MSCFILDNIDSNSVNNFSILREIIQHDDFSYFLEAYSDYFDNFSVYRNNNKNYKEKGDYIKNSITHLVSGLTVTLLFGVQTR